MQRKIIQLVNESISRQPIAAQAAINFARTQLFEFDQLTDHEEYVKFITKISKPYLAKIIQPEKRAKWLEPLTIYDYQMRPLRENVPRGLVHELALPHGASDCLVYHPQTQKILVNIRQDDGYLEGIGGHKGSGLTFKENMLKELLEELFSYATQNPDHEFKNSLEFLALRNIDLYNTLAEHMQEVYRSINVNNKGGLLNIHVSALHVLAVDVDLITRFKPDEDSSATMHWFSFAEIEELLRNADPEYAVLRVLWEWFKQSAYYKEIKQEK
jgi:hypothetical protein